MLPFGTQVFILVSLAVVTFLTVTIYNIFIKILSADEREKAADNPNESKKVKKDKKERKNRKKGNGEHNGSDNTAVKPEAEKNETRSRTGTRRTPVTPPKAERTATEKTDNSPSANGEIPFNYESDVQNDEFNFKTPVQDRAADPVRRASRTPVTPPTVSHGTVKEKNISAGEPAEDISPTTTRSFDIDNEIFINTKESTLPKRSASRRTPVTPGRKD